MSRATVNCRRQSPSSAARSRSSAASATRPPGFPGPGPYIRAAAAAHGEVILNATNGAASIPALISAGAANLRGKIILDIANPLDFSKGMPPSLFVSNTDSLAEQIQRAFPESKVVKTLNTLNAHLMANPADLGDITTARGTEMLLPIWIRLWGAIGSPMFNFKIVR